jgi:hypothetical protein
MSNSIDEFTLSLLKSLLKYSRHLFLISSSLVRSCSVAFLMHFIWMMSLIFLFLCFWSSYICPSPLPSYPVAGIVHHTSDPFVHSPSIFAVFFATLYHSILSALLSRCIRLKYSFFSLIAFYTFSFHHHVSLVSRLPPLVTPNSSETNFLMQVVIFIHILFASPPSCQGLSLMTLSLNVFAASSLDFHHFILGTWTHLLC